MYSPGIPAFIPNPKYLRPLFSAKRARIVLPALLGTALLVCMLVFLPGYIDSMSYGDTEAFRLIFLLTIQKPWTAQRNFLEPGR